MVAGAHALLQMGLDAVRAVGRPGGEGTRLGRLGRGRGEFEGNSKNCPIHFFGFKKLLRTIIPIYRVYLIRWYIEVMH